MFLAQGQGGLQRRNRGAEPSPRAPPGLRTTRRGFGTARRRTMRVAASAGQGKGKASRERLQTSKGRGHPGVWWQGAAKCRHPVVLGRKAEGAGGRAAITSYSITVRREWSHCTSRSAARRQVPEVPRRSERCQPHVQVLRAWFGLGPGTQGLPARVALTPARVGGMSSCHGSACGYPPEHIRARSHRPGACALSCFPLVGRLQQAAAHSHLRE